MYDVTESVSSSRLVAAASKTLQSVQSKQACKSLSVSLVHLFTVLTTGLADLSFGLYAERRLTRQWSVGLGMEDRFQISNNQVFEKTCAFQFRLTNPVFTFLCDFKII